MSFKLMLDLEFYNKKKKQSINLSHLYYEAAARPDSEVSFVTFSRVVSSVFNIHP